MSNTITVTGNLTDAPELKFSQSGQAIGKLSVADNENRKQADGTWEQIGVTFWRCTLFGKQAEAAAEMVKGTQVVVTGRAKTHTWDTDAGEKRSSLEVIVQAIGAVPNTNREHASMQPDRSQPANNETAPF